MPHSGYTICTSEQRPTSTAVSHGFVVERYSSPPFGSHGPCKHSESCPLDFGTGVPCSPVFAVCLSLSRLSLSLSLRNSNPIIWESCLHYALLALGFRSTSQQASSIDSLVRVSRRAESGTDTAKLKLPTCTLHHLGSPGSHRATSTNQCSHRCLPRAPRPYTTGQ